MLSTTPREFQKQGASKKSLDGKPDSGKRSATMILAHVADTEIVYAFRLRLMLGASGITIQGIDQDAWAVIFNYGAQDPAASAEDFRVNRERTLRMLEKLSRDQIQAILGK